jgi:hypothetical protein
MAAGDFNTRAALASSAADSAGQPLHAAMSKRSFTFARRAGFWFCVWSQGEKLSRLVTECHPRHHRFRGPGGAGSDPLHLLHHWHVCHPPWGGSRAESAVCCARPVPGRADRQQQAQDGDDVGAVAELDDDGGSTPFSPTTPGMYSNHGDRGQGGERRPSIADGGVAFGQSGLHASRCGCVQQHRQRGPSGADNQAPLSARELFSHAPYHGHASAAAALLHCIRRHFLLASSSCGRLTACQE